MTTPVVLQSDGSPVVQQTDPTPVIVPGDAGAAVVVQTQTKTVVVAVAKQGPPGPAGGGNYEHPQTIAAAVWTVPHNLGRHPAVSVTDHLGNLVIADIQYIDTNIVQITHGIAMTGFAYCN